MAKREKVVRGWMLFTGDCPAIDGYGRPFVAFAEDDVYNGQRIPNDRIVPVEIRIVRPAKGNKRKAGKSARAAKGGA